MAEEVEIFEHEQFGEVRTVTIDGEPWFVGKDVAEALGYSNTREAVRTHVSAGQRQGAEIALPGDVVPSRNFTIISEAGVWRLVMRSNKDEAVRFQDWLAEEVIPSIRKTGRYQVAAPTSKSEALRLWGEEILKRAEAERKLEEAAPRAELMNLFEDKHGLDVGAVASLFGYRSHQFHEMMRSWGATYYNERGQIDPSPYWVEREWLGRRKTNTTIVLPKGLQRLEHILGRQVVGQPKKEITK